MTKNILITSSADYSFPIEYNVINWSRMTMEQPTYVECNQSTAAL